MQYLQSNTTLQGGKYRIERVLGQGGFGITYRAIMRDRVSGKLGAMEIEVPVAIKEFFMKDTCLRDEGSSYVTVPSIGSKNLVEQYRKKFVKEANNLSNLNHPNIVQVIDVFQENGTDYYVMEYLEGGSLRDVVKREGKLDEKRALGYITLIGYALSYMHTEKHLCHYDVKPGNIVLDKKGTPKLIDFGISKNYDSEGNQTSSTPIGISEGFAPLEQYKQTVQEFSPQTDVYALGATLYYLLCGKVPPEASDVVNDGLPSLPYTISKSTRDAIEQAMQPRKKDRPQTMKEFLELLLENAVPSPQPIAKPKPVVSKPRVEDDDDEEATYYADEGAITSTPPYKQVKPEEDDSEETYYADEGLSKVSSQQKLDTPDPTAQQPVPSVVNPMPNENVDESKRNEKVRMLKWLLPVSIILLLISYFGFNSGSIDYTTYNEKLVEAAENGDATAQYNLGLFYAEGTGVIQDYTKAAEWYTKSAEQGNANAQNNLGVCYAKGTGVIQDYTKAAEWFTKSAEQGNVMGQTNLGGCYLRGDGVQQDYSKAFERFREAANQGDANGQFLLGYCYEKGIGVSSNIPVAVSWYNKASEQGNEDAKERLKELQVNN